MSRLEDIASAVANAAEPPEDIDAPPDQPRILVDDNNPDRTVCALRDVLVGSGQVYDRGVPVRVAFDQTRGTMIAHPITSKGLAYLAHRIARPYRVKSAGGAGAEVDTRLPILFAEMYLDMKGEWNLPLLNGIAASPLLRDDGSIADTKGFDTLTGMWCDDPTDIASLVPEHPTREDAVGALRTLRRAFHTFPFADAEMQSEGGIQVVDGSRRPGRDESAFLAALLTAICRASLALAPGVMIHAPSYSGAGTGKGLLARCMAAIAFGRQPHAVTAGSGLAELEKRIGAELIGGSPMLLLDNLNGMSLKSDLLASAITERPARFRILGRSEMVAINSSCFIVLTGNGLTVAEDLVRRFLTCELDAKTEDPEARRFHGDIVDDLMRRRPELLAACLTIWRWGRRCSDLAHGQPLGSFNQWCRWVRDPLIALGCCDPAERVREAKQRDAHRETVMELLRAWNRAHGDRPVAIRDLDPSVLAIVDPNGRGRQFVASAIQKLDGTRAAGFVLMRHTPNSKHGVTTYRLLSCGDADLHPGRGYDSEGGSADLSHPDPMIPMHPMLSDFEEEMEFEEECKNDRIALLTADAPLDEGQRHRDHQDHRDHPPAARHSDGAGAGSSSTPSKGEMRRVVGSRDVGTDIEEPWSTEL